mmetsp:Transcript_18504/g.53741  ORF Transcript_18504/g.53741 Transcript_18504/m.53741 type:complete len:309 (+) Transcript_18504:287-1213(+)
MRDARLRARRGGSPGGALPGAARPSRFMASLDFFLAFRAPAGQRWQKTHSRLLWQPTGLWNQAHGRQVPDMCSSEPWLGTSGASSGTQAGAGNGGAGAAAARAAAADPAASPSAGSLSVPDSSSELEEAAGDPAQVSCSAESASACIASNSESFTQCGVARPRRSPTAAASASAPYSRQGVQGGCGSSGNPGHDACNGMGTGDCGGRGEKQPIAKLSMSSCERRRALQLIDSGESSTFCGSAAASTRFLSGSADEAVTPSSAVCAGASSRMLAGNRTLTGSGQSPSASASMHKASASDTGTAVMQPCG